VLLSGDYEIVVEAVNDDSFTSEHVHFYSTIDHYQEELRTMSCPKIAKVISRRLIKIVRMLRG